MTVLRSVLAHFAVDVDVKPLTEMDRKINKLKGNIGTIAGVAATAFGAAAAAAWGLVNAASHADETLQALRRTFGDAATKDIERFSDTLGHKVGRSLFDIQEGVLKFGAFLEPQFKGTTTDIIAMSKELSKLSIDLAAFYDTSDEEAQMRLFSGISGETEAVRRLGIDISDATLDDFHKKRGGKGRMASLSLPEKTMLRFHKILEDTEKKQGTAAAEAQQWAGSLKRVEGHFKNIAVKWGRRLQKTLLPLLKTFESLFLHSERFFETAIKNTMAFETALTLAGQAAAFMTARMIALAAVSYMFDLAAGITSLNKWIPLLRTAAGYLAAFLVIEDIWIFMKGGQSTAGEFVKWLYAVEDPLKTVSNSMEELAVNIHNTWVEMKKLAALMPTFQALAYIRGGSQGLEDYKKFIEAQAKGEMLDPAARERQENEMRSEAWDSLLMEGTSKSLSEAANKFRRIDETPEAAFARAVKERATLVRQGLAPIGLQDIASSGAVAAGKGPLTHTSDLTIDKDFSVVPQNRTLMAPPSMLAAPGASAPSAPTGKTIVINNKIGDRLLEQVIVDGLTGEIRKAGQSDKDNH